MICRLYTGDELQELKDRLSEMDRVEQLGPAEKAAYFGQEASVQLDMIQSTAQTHHDQVLQKLSNLEQRLGLSPSAQSASTSGDGRAQLLADLDVQIGSTLPLGSAPSLVPAQALSCHSLLREGKLTAIGLKAYLTALQHLMAQPPVLGRIEFRSFGLIELETLGKAMRTHSGKVTWSDASKLREEIAKLANASQGEFVIEAVRADVTATNCKFIRELASHDASNVLPPAPWQSQGEKRLLTLLC